MYIIFTVTSWKCGRRRRPKVSYNREPQWAKIYIHSSVCVCVSVRNYKDKHWHHRHWHPDNTENDDNDQTPILTPINYKYQDDLLWKFFVLWHSVYGAELFIGKVFSVRFPFHRWILVYFFIYFTFFGVHCVIFRLPNKRKSKNTEKRKNG